MLVDALSDGVSGMQSSKNGALISQARAGARVQIHDSESPFKAEKSKK